MTENNQQFEVGSAKPARTGRNRHPGASEPGQGALTGEAAMVVKRVLAREHGRVEVGKPRAVFSARLREVTPDLAPAFGAVLVLESQNESGSGGDRAKHGLHRFGQGKAQTVDIDFEVVRHGSGLCPGS